MALTREHDYVTLPADPQSMRDGRAPIRDPDVLALHAGGRTGDEDLYWEVLDHLPRETRNYVAAVTGRTVEEWRDEERKSAAEPEAGAESCLEVLAALDAPPPAALASQERQAEWQPWGVQVAGNFSQSRALATYRHLQERHPAVLAERSPLILRKRNLSLGTREMVNVRVPAPTREAANDLCRRLREEGAACIVLKN